MSRFGGAPKCPVCDKSVYFAEEVVAEGKKFHKACFKCSQCNKMLDSSTATAHEGTLYCHPCHRRNFGLKGYGYGQGAGVLATDSGGTGSWNPPAPTSGGGAGGGSRYGGADKCPRCGKTVYMAEKIVGAGSSWHKGCFNCSSCKKKLDSTTVCDKDGEIYCKACYGKQFGPKGVGFGQGAGTLTMT